MHETDLEVGFPFQLDTRGRAADPDWPQHVRDMVELVLFTSPGERLNRPDFGCGLIEAVFAPGTAEEVGVIQHLTRAQLERWLGDVMTVTSLTIDVQETTLNVRIEYELIGNREQQAANFELRELPWHI